MGDRSIVERLRALSNALNEMAFLEKDEADIRLYRQFEDTAWDAKAEIERQADRIETLEAALKWVGEVYPDTLPSRGARVEMTWDEFNAMREVMGLSLRKPKPRARAALNGGE